jgi:hypothetical protein
MDFQGEFAERTILRGRDNQILSGVFHETRLSKERFSKQLGKGPYRHSWMMVLRGSCLTWSIVGVTRGVTGKFLRSRRSIRLRRRRSRWVGVIHVLGKIRCPMKYPTIGVSSSQKTTRKMNTNELVNGLYIEGKMEGSWSQIDPIPERRGELQSEERGLMGRGDI